MADKIEVENVNTPGRVTRVDAAKYHDMRQAMMKILQPGAPGLTAAEIQAAVKAHVSEDLFPGGATVGWWMKSVQLDLEAKKLLQRSTSSPLRFSRIG